jgi:hypothetical protein
MTQTNGRTDCPDFTLSCGITIHRIRVEAGAFAQLFLGLTESVQPQSSRTPTVRHLSGMVGPTRDPHCRLGNPGLKTLGDNSCA